MRYWIVFAIFSLLPVLGMSQHATEEHSAGNPHPVHPHFRIAGLMAHTYVPAGVSEKHLFIPSWGLDLEWWPNSKWGIGLHNDLELQAFIVEQDGHEFLEREYPLVLSLDMLYRPYRGWVLQIGPGYELEKEQNFFLLRAGIEYEFEIHDQHKGVGSWDISPMIFYDNRIAANDTWSIGLGIGRRF